MYFSLKRKYLSRSINYLYIINKWNTIYAMTNHENKIYCIQVSTEYFAALKKLIRPE